MHSVFFEEYGHVYKYTRNITKSQIFFFFLLLSSCSCIYEWKHRHLGRFVMIFFRYRESQKVGRGKGGGVGGEVGGEEYFLDLPCSKMMLLSYGN